MDEVRYWFPTIKEYLSKENSMYWSTAVSAWYIFDSWIGNNFVDEAKAQSFVLPQRRKRKTNSLIDLTERRKETADTRDDETQHKCPICDVAIGKEKVHDCPKASGVQKEFVVCSAERLCEMKMLVPINGGHRCLKCLNTCHAFCGEGAEGFGSSVICKKCKTDEGIALDVCSSKVTSESVMKGKDAYSSKKVTPKQTSAKVNGSWCFDKLN